MAFLGQLSDGRRGLFLSSGTAAPSPPQAAVFKYVGPPAGSFGVAGNWARVTPQPPAPEAARVPEKSDTHADTALFDEEGAFTVELGPSRAPLAARRASPLASASFQHVDRLRFESGEVTLTRGALLADRLSFDTPSLTVDNARLILRDGLVLTNNHALIGVQAVSKVELLGPGVFSSPAEARYPEWITRGSLRVGGPGEGILVVEGGFLRSAETRIGTGEPGGAAIVRGDGFWATGNLAIGMGGDGRLKIEGYGIVESEQIVMGHDPGGLNVLIVDGETTPAGGVALLNATRLEIGREGGGDVFVTSGGLVSVNGMALLAARHRSSASLTVGGSNTMDAARMSAHELTVGQAGFGLVTIEEGGQVRIEKPAQFATVVQLGGGQAGVGEITVTGRTREAAPSTLAVLGGRSELRVGSENGLGRLNISGGGRVLLDGDMFVRCVRDGRDSRVVLEGDALLRVGSILAVGEDGDFGRGLIVMLDDPVIEATVLVVRSKGRVEGQFTRIGVQNLAPGFQGQVSASDGRLRLTAVNDGVFEPSLPGKVEAVVTNVGGIAYATMTLTRENSCQKLELGGPVTRVGRGFRQEVAGTRVLGIDCQEVPQVEKQVRVLGVVEPGEYVFEIVSGGQVVGRVPFAAPAADPTFLKAVRLPNGHVRVELRGPEGVPYSLEACESLPNWRRFEAGVLPAAVTDDGAASFRTRFYRAAIGP